MRDALEQWKYAAFDSGRSDRWFWLMTLILIPVLLVAGIVCIVLRFVLQTYTSSMFTLAAILCPVMAIIGFILVLVLVRNS